MAICVQFDINGHLRALATSAEECTAYILLDATEFGALVTPLDIDPAAVAEWYAFGFGVVMIPWALAYATRWAVKTVKLL